MSSEAAHSRKSRLTVPAGGDPLKAPLKASTKSGGSGKTGGAFSSAGGAAAGLSGTNIHNPMQYLQRLLDVRQMDIQSALDQMRTLVSTRPHVVYKTAYYRKQTKNHWARDDPAFVALLTCFLVIASIAYSVAFRTSFTGAISFLLYTLLWNWIGMGCILATMCREIANRHLLTVNQSSSHVRQQVEWLYAFDIHCNAFFPVFVVLYGLQFFLLPLVLGEGLIPLLVANTLYAVAISWYWYITHLGYRTLPFLTNTEVFLFPVAAVVLLAVVMFIGYFFGFGFNASRVMARFYFF